MDRIAAFMMLFFAPVPALYAGEITHLGVRAEDLIAVELAKDVDGGCGKEKLEFVRLHADGTSSHEGFRIPRGKALVVTDFDWYYSGGTPGQVIILSLIVENISDAAKRRRAAESTVRLGADGVGGASVRMTTGFVVSSRARLCAETINGPVGTPMRLSKVLVRGYLVDQAEER
jgi:hypothetical protein